ncbi:MAG: Phenylalanine-tRNA ligase beta subunit [Candidatus Uhrbacteria bacterium GW2011_GWE2_45_35]|uniref:Phenylalanine--tRNA ligase beta subunit n=2 Tax=Candidatus Uhriibacteriota TaxID=1752732 RepID=A0A0G1JF13_9BACT|nr:MAG: Phenylalanine-tRNA ligase beta subunit [Candidatus Uhrbacteria bacterium GW2011_GWF2_44_350]KKU06881.1 MAG: Phenylalanine-tRNA ligase beta subunit [Candidatus Uhrbacteria bacterium GW2011_GWE2_45_35]
MLLSKNWLKDFVDFPDGLSDQDLAEHISDCTVEVEHIDSQAAPLEKIVVGKILKIEAHPNADKLRVCSVDVGIQNFEPVQIVCGGSNLSDNMKVAVATVGAKVKWHGEGEPVEIQPTKLRGVESFGMICSANEIGLATGQEGEREIVDLSYLEVEPGTSLAAALGLNDTIIDVDNKSLTNRPDLFSHHGMGREIAALLNVKFKELEPAVIKEGKGYDLDIKVIDPDLCPRYLGVVIDGVKIEPSPEWLQKRLLAVGMRPINNIVDITNYVMLEVGQSLHAFDVNKLENASGTEKQIEVIIKRATDGEKFTTLDGEEHELDGNDLMICDGRKSITLAGIMGGQNSEIDDNTTAVFLESANFNPSGIRKTSQKLGLRSEASLRYEKSLDPNFAEAAICRTVELFLEIVPGTKVVSELVDISNFELPQGPIVLSLDYLNQKLGLEIPEKDAVGILERLGFEIKKKARELSVTIPTWRATKDISIAEDLIEEIARVYGYRRIPCDLPELNIAPPEQDPVRSLERQVRHLMAGRFKATETYNYSFVSPVTLTRLQEDLSQYIELANPISKERPYLRRCLAPNLLENVEKNQRFVDTVSLFEIGCRYIPEDAGEVMGEGDGVLPLQDHYLGIAYSAKGEAVPFKEVKRMTLGVLTELGFSAEFVVREGESWLHPVRSANIVVRGEKVGYLAEVEPNIGQGFGLENRVAVAELNLSRLAVFGKTEIKYLSVPEFPEVKRDLAFVVAKETIFAKLEKALRKNSKLLNEVELFDVYQGKGIDPDKKSVAVHLVFRSSEKTLSSEEVDNEVSDLRSVLSNEFNAIIR